MNLIKKVAQISLLVLFISCNNSEVLIETKISTQENRYRILVDLPKEFDTSYVWTDFSDNTCSDTKKYRFTRTTFPLYKESGWGCFVPEDSLYRFTIKHVNKFLCKEVLDGERWIPVQKVRERLNLRGTIDSIKIHKIYNTVIDNRKFLITQFKQKRKQGTPYWNYVTKALTIVDSNYISFDFEIKREKHISTEFETMNKVMNSIVIEK